MSELLRPSGVSQDKDLELDIDTVLDLGDTLAVHQSMQETVRDLWGDEFTRLAKKYIKPNEVFAVSMEDLLGFGDKPFIQQLIEVFEDKKRPVISVEEVSLEATSRFGVVDIKKSNKRLHEVRSIIEKPGPKLAPSRLVLTGKYILTPDIFVCLESLVKSHASGEVRLADALSMYAEKNGMLAYQCIGEIQDTGNKLDFIKTMIKLSLEHKTLGKQIRKYLKSINI